MTDSVAVFDPLWRLTDANGDPVSGGYAEFYQSGTSTPLTVYSDAGLSASLGSTVYVDSGGAPVSTQGGNTKVLVYTGTTDLKVILKDADAATLATYDSMPGALDTSTYSTTTAQPEIPVLAKASSTWSVSTSDGPVLYNANVTGASQVVTFPSAITAGDGYLFGIRHDGLGSSNTVTYQTVASQTIKEGTDAAGAAGVLIGYGETRWFLSDGSGWTVWAYVPPFSRAGQPILIADRLTAAPASPTAGAKYIINGTPTGTWLSLGFAQHDVVEANGIGGWLSYTPATDSGWLAYVQDEDLLIQHRGTAWVDLSNIAAPTSSNLRTMLVQEQQTNGTNGGSATADAWTTRTLNTEVLNDITIANGAASDASLATNAVTLPAGTYFVSFTSTFGEVAAIQTRFKSTTTATAVTSPLSWGIVGSAYNFLSTGSGIFTIASSEAFELQYFVDTAKATTGLGTAHASATSNTEIYASVTIIDLSAKQGTTGATGAQGATGRDAGIGRWAFSTTTTEADPSAGNVRFDNATAASITEVYIHETDADAAAMAGFIATIASGGLMQFRKAGTPGTFITLSVSGATTDNGTWWSIPVTYVNGATPSNADSLLLNYVVAASRAPTYTVATLPAGSAGDMAYASDGRKNGEGGGSGTGVLVFKDGTAWRACDTGATVAA